MNRNREAPVPFARYQGRAINYEFQHYPHKPTLMFANSLGTDLGMWDAQAKALANEFSILRFDARGHGRSEANSLPASIDDLASDALAVMDDAGVNQVHFVGLSLGGMVGQALALNAPERILSLVLCATGATLPPPDLWEKRAETALTEGLEPIVAASLERWFTPTFRAVQAAEVERNIAMLRVTDPGSYAACCRVIRDTDLRPRLSALRTRVLLIAGADDPATPPSRLEEIHALVPVSELVVLEQAAHILNVEQPDAVSDHIRRFASTHAR